MHPNFRISNVLILKYQIASLVSVSKCSWKTTWPIVVKFYYLKTISNRFAVKYLQVTIQNFCIKGSFNTNNFSILYFKIFSFNLQIFGPKPILISFNQTKFQLIRSRNFWVTFKKLRLIRDAYWHFKVILILKTS